MAREICLRKPEPVFDLTPQSCVRTAESVLAEQRVRQRYGENPFWSENESPMSNRDWLVLDQRITFVSPNLGELYDIEENRLAARAHDVMGWPIAIMSGATKVHATSQSCGMNIRQMAGVRYDPNLHRDEYGKP